eukprot:GHVS01039004.1.p1 GENE.GHVS01039004.1~~GHVS01039004.1.p1  ORF type:complete len:283 (+),score=33.56 GHVS01039004.1:70-918(+)
MCLWSLLSCCLCCCGSRNKLLTHAVVVGGLLAPLLLAQLIYIGCHSSNLQILQEELPAEPQYVHSPSSFGDQTVGWSPVLRSLATKFMGHLSWEKSSSSIFLLSNQSDFPCPIMPKYLHWQLLHEHFPALRDSLETPSVWLYHNSVALLPPQTARPIALAAVALILYIQTVLLIMLAVYVSWRLVIAPVVQVCWWLLCLAVVVVVLLKVLKLFFTLYGSEVVADQSTHDFLTDVFDHINQSVDSLFFWLISRNWSNHLTSLLVSISSLHDSPDPSLTTNDEL